MASSSGEKPDNSAHFFSARKASSGVLTMQANSVFGKNIDHPWRYFVAGGPSLDKIAEVQAAAKNVGAEMQALAAEVGASELSGSYFTFPGAESVAVVPQMRFRHAYQSSMVCDATAPGSFFLDPDYGDAADLKKAVAALDGKPKGEVDAGYAALAKKYNADSFDGKFFQFNNWEDNIEAVRPPREKQFRLKSNPAFVRGAFDGDLYSADRGTDAGLEIATRLSDIGRKQYPEQRYADWIASFELDISLSGRSERDRKQAEVEKIGDEWIIKVPVITEGIFGADGKGGVISGYKEGWVLPPGATPIAVSDYYAKLEKSGSLRALPNAGPKPN